MSQYDFASFNPRTPCGVRRSSGIMTRGGGKVSIHALLAECDRSRRWTKPKNFRFQSTHSLRSATVGLRPELYLVPVSIHALLAECDYGESAYARGQSGFNPRTPCGVRLKGRKKRISLLKFQSTHSLRSATEAGSILDPIPRVSIHALLAECDYRCKSNVPPIRGFNPRTPCGVRLPVVSFGPDDAGFQSTHSLRSATLFPVPIPPGSWFQSTHSLRSATHASSMASRNRQVSIHALLAECDAWAADKPATISGFQSTHSLRSATRLAG